MRFSPLIAALICLPVIAIELKDGKVEVTPVEVHRLSQCEEQGGCHVVTVQMMLEIVKQAQKAAVDEYKAVCRNSI